MASTEGRVAKPERRWDCWDSVIQVKSKIGLAVNGLNLANTDSSQVCVFVFVQVNTVTSCCWSEITLLWRYTYNVSILADTLDILPLYVFVKEH